MISLFLSFMNMVKNVAFVKYFFFIIIFIPIVIQSQNSESRSLHQVVEQEILPHLDELFTKLNLERLDFELDGVRPFDKPHEFLPGKIAIGFSYLLLETPRASPKYAEYISGYRELADMTLHMDNTKWGTYYYMLALYRLQKGNILNEAISKNTLELLKTKLDWRNFVSTPGYKLKGGLPTNYFGVAFSIARLRFLMGWESEEGSNRLLEIMLKHIDKHSGEYGFSDETEGQGRFDRYSVLLMAELCARFIDTNSKVPEKLNGRMRKTVDFILPLMNEKGHGFQYGRSIGPYGDGMFVEMLSAAAMMGILSKKELDAAYTFQVLLSERLMNFWYDSDMGSLNLWEKGRITETYRGKHRILDENFSLLHQHLSSYGLWKKLGYSNKKPSTEYNSWLKTLPQYDFTWFSKGTYDRAHLTVRDNQRIIQLPIIGGGKNLHGVTSYFPIPFSADLLQGSPFKIYPQLIPRITLEEGLVLEPLSYFRNIRTKQNSSEFFLDYHQEELDRIGSNKKGEDYSRNPSPDDRFSIETSYYFNSGVITRTDIITPKEPLKNVQLTMEFAGFSKDAVIKGNKVIYGDGKVTSFETSGYQNITVETHDMSPKYASPTGAMNTVVKVSSKLEDFSEPITVSWTLKYKN
ncbi:hypothetical protein N1F78_15220 [Seonamhaeicola sp. MEBiC1930]|uniref:hypothetical protein n=1 Tax=Seonamhaeicola sp. MEBiC01930 TaxID=2976768 RepID=UPI00324AF48B